ncbi:MAG: hypothetical protein ACLQCB_16095 [Spirochaetia bacterium]
MWYTVVITLVVDVGGLLLVYTLLRDRVRRATSAAAQMAELREEVSRLVVELNQTTERNVALLEDRISGLSDLLAAADRKIALLQREIEKHDVGVKVYSKLAEGASSSAAPQRQGPSRETLLREALPQEAPPRQEPPRQEPRLSVELSERVEEGRKRTEPGAGAPSPKADVHQKVVMLSRSGFSAPLIAARVGMPLGEVELIISLERQRMSQASERQGEEPA